MATKRRGVTTRGCRRGSRGVALALGIGSVAACGDSPVQPGEPGGLDAQVVAFVDAMNGHRVGEGCPALTWNTKVAAVARAHSQDMIDRDFFAHTNPDGASPFDRLAEAGVEFSGAAENIAWGYPTGQAVLEAWLNSSGHRANIENCGLTEHGVGLVGTHWTHVFIRP